MEDQGKRVDGLHWRFENPRIERSEKHQLPDIIPIAICAVIGGADTRVHVAMYGRSREEWFRTFLELPNSIPSHHTPACGDHCITVFTAKAGIQNGKGQRTDMIQTPFNP